MTAPSVALILGFAMGGRPLTSRGISHVNEKDLKGPRLGICLGTIVIRKRHLMNN